MISVDTSLLPIFGQVSSLLPSTKIQEVRPQWNVICAGRLHIGLLKNVTKNVMNPRFTGGFHFEHEILFIFPIIRLYAGMREVVTVSAKSLSIIVDPENSVICMDLDPISKQIGQITPKLLASELFLEGFLLANHGFRGRRRFSSSAEIQHDFIPQIWSLLCLHISFLHKSTKKRASTAYLQPITHNG